MASIDFKGLRARPARHSARHRTGPREPGTALSPAKSQTLKRTAPATARAGRLPAAPASRTSWFPLPARPGEFRLNLRCDGRQPGRDRRRRFRGNEVFTDEELDGRARRPGRKASSGSAPARTTKRSCAPTCVSSSPATTSRRGYLDFAVIGRLDRDRSGVRQSAADHSGRRRPAVQAGRVQRRRVTATSRRKRSSATSRKRAGTFLGRELRRQSTREGGLGLRRARVHDARRTGSGRLYSNQGYLYAQIMPRTWTRSRAAERGARNLGDPGGRARIHSTRSRSSATRTRTKTWSVTSCSLLPGDVYSEQLLIQSYRRIGAPASSRRRWRRRASSRQETGDVDITFEVKEKQTGSVNFGTAVGGGTGLAGFLGYDQPNLFGKAKSRTPALGVRPLLEQLRGQLQRSGDHRLALQRLALAVQRARPLLPVFGRPAPPHRYAALRVGVPRAAGRSAAGFSVGYSLVTHDVREVRGQTRASSLFCAAARAFRARSRSA